MTTPDAATRYEPSDTDEGICWESMAAARHKLSRVQDLLLIRAFGDAARDLRSAASDLIVAAERLEKP